MIGDRRVAALIPARGGSKSLPGKNLQILAGKSLLRWAVDVAKSVGAIDAVYVSTDDEAIADEGGRAGAEIAVRPPELATDASRVIDTIRHHLAAWKSTPAAPDVVVLLQPTSPLRLARDIEACLRPLSLGTHDSAATFRPCRTYPQRLWRLADDCATPFVDGPDRWLPRQELPELYEINGAVYAFLADRLPATAGGPLFGRIAPVLMPAERSVDIDTALDLVLAETILSTRP